MARQRKHLEPISIEELRNAPGMSGFVSFLNIKPTEVDHTSEIESTPVVSTPVVSTQAEATPAIPISETQAHSTPVESTGVVYAPVDSPLGPSAYSRQLRIHEVRVLQDSLSYGEEALYNALYSQAEPSTSDAKKITIGFERMSRLARLTDKNCKLNCRSLMNKRVLEEIADTNFRDGRTYLVYNFKAALQRQRQSGLTHVVRTRGVVFVDPQTGRELTPKVHTRRRSTPVDSTPVNSESTRLEATDSTRLGSADSTPVNSSPYIRNSQIASQTSLSVVRDALARYSAVDDDAVHVLIKRCRLAAPDASNEEIAHFVDYKGRSMPPKLDNPLGWLIVYVPKCFPGELQALRNEKKQQDEEERIQEAIFRADMDRIVSDPNADEWERKLAAQYFAAQGKTTPG